MRILLKADQKTKRLLRLAGNSGKPLLRTPFK
jgi:hypothetical protein